MNRQRPVFKNFGLLIIELYTIPSSVMPSQLWKDSGFYDTHGFFDQYIEESLSCINWLLRQDCILILFLRGFLDSNIATVSINLLKESKSDQYSLVFKFVVFLRSSFRIILQSVFTVLKLIYFLLCGATDFTQSKLYFIWMKTYRLLTIRVKFFDETTGSTWF
jgi:hypothetical protein